MKMLLLLLIPSMAFTQGKFKEIAAGTTANLKGHTELYQNGWKFISSGQKSFEYAGEVGIKSSKEAIEEMLSDLAKHSDKFKNAIPENIKAGEQTAKKTHQVGSQISKSIRTEGLKQSAQLYQYSGELIKNGWDSLTTGQLTLVERTKKDREALKNTPRNYFKGLNDDWSNFKKLLEPIELESAQNIAKDWDESYAQAKKEFQSEYEKSGEQTNSFSALPYVLWGNLKYLYYAILKPSSKSSVSLGTKAIVYPVAATVIWAKGTVLTTGLTVYHAANGTYQIFAPTIEGGFLAGLSLASLGASGATAAGGVTLGAINQVATEVLSTAAGTTEATGKSVLDSGSYVANISYDLVKGTSKVVINSGKAGVVLGYHALTAIPAHLILGTADVAYFIAWDGPRLAIYAARGNAAERLPVGTTVDIKKMMNKVGTEIKKISDDQELIHKIIMELPKDLEHGH